MIGIFKKTSEVDKLQKAYNKAMKEWHTLSSTNRSESDKKYAQAQDILNKIEAIQTKK